MKHVIISKKPGRIVTTDMFTCNMCGAEMVRGYSYEVRFGHLNRSIHVDVMRTFDNHVCCDCVLALKSYVHPEVKS